MELELGWECNFPLKAHCSGENFEKVVIGKILKFHVRREFTT